MERKLRRLLARSLDELNVAWFHYDTPNPAGSSPLAASHRVITKRCAHSAAMLGTSPAAGRFASPCERQTGYNCVLSNTDLAVASRRTVC